MVVKLKYLILMLLLSTMAQAQSGIGTDGSRQSLFISPDDTISHIDIPQVTVYPLHPKMTSKEFREYSILERKVKKVYPMAKMAAEKLTEYNRAYTSFKTERERKKYVKEAEKDLFNEFEGEITQMKVSEGRILIKLLDRETGNSSYEIIKEFKGGFSAFFWQGVARLFGHDLKAQYDPAKEDRWIEYIVWQIDMGII